MINKLSNVIICNDYDLIICIDSPEFNYNLVKKTLEEEKVDVILHSAAYKHVPLVENNPLQGIYNNVITILNNPKLTKECSQQIASSTKGRPFFAHDLLAAFLLKFGVFC